MSNDHNQQELENKPQETENEQQKQLRPDYLDLYYDYVVPTVETCMKEMTNLDFRREYDPVSLLSEDYKRKYVKAFRKNRRALTDLFYGDEDHGYLNPEKIAAVLCHTLIDCKPIKFTGRGTITANTIASATD